MKPLPTLRVHIVPEAGGYRIVVVSPSGEEQPDSHPMYLFEGDRLTMPVVSGPVEIAFGPPEPEPDAPHVVG